MMTKFSKILCGCITAAVMATSVPATAGEKSKLVHYDDLDLASATGQKRFHTRIKSAVNKVCGAPRAFTLAEKVDRQRCIDNAMAQAMPKAEQTIARYQESKRLAANETALVGN